MINCLHFTSALQQSVIYLHDGVALNAFPQKKNIAHVMITKDFLLKLEIESDKFKQDLESHKTNEQITTLLKIVKECQGLENSIIDYRRSAESQIQNIKQLEAKFRSYQNNLVINSFGLDDINLNELLNIHLLLANKNPQLMSLDNLKQQLYQIESIIKDYQETKKDESNPIIDLKIENTLLNKLIKQMVYQLIFSDPQYQKMKNIWHMEDSSQLYIGLQGGCVYGFDAQDNFKEIFKQQIHQDDIYNLITIQNEYLVTCSYDSSIIKTNIKSKQQIFKLTGHTNWIKAVDYNDKDEITVSGSFDQSIKLWNCKIQSIIINKENSHNNDIIQIQLLNDNLNILSLDLAGNLYKWQIDFGNKDLIKIQQFNFNENRIFNFYQINQDQNLLLICKNFAKILNLQGEFINTIEHGGIGEYPWHCRQLDNLKFMLIRTYTQIILGIAED